MTTNYPPRSGMRPKAPTGRERALVMRLHAELSALREQHARLVAQREVALVDHVTGLYGRHYFDKRLSQEFSRAQRFKDPLSLVIVELDDLKRMGDTMGHESADGVLRWVADLVASSCRAFDVACRIDTSELALMLPSTNAAGARAVITRLQRICESADDKPDVDVDIVLSFGHACVPEHAETPLELVIAAEEQMFLDKRARPASSRAVVAA